MQAPLGCQVWEDWSDSSLCHLSVRLALFTKSAVHFLSVMALGRVHLAHCLAAQPLPKGIPREREADLHAESTSNSQAVGTTFVVGIKVSNKVGKAKPLYTEHRCATSTDANLRILPKVYGGKSAIIKLFL